MPEKKKQARRYSLTHCHSGWKKELVKKQLEEASTEVEKWKIDLNGIDEHVKKVSLRPRKPETTWRQR